MSGCIHAVHSKKRIEATSDVSTILERLESVGIVVEYQCREGYCGSCRVTLLHGKVGYKQKPIAFVQDGEILPCCCHPLSDIEIG
ncbi:class I ribonucleotide reductase maintenance protein YfaE [Providencia huaxiensis]|uniref:class I ribonucleotide reductase maintenance protein YfaE n=1 Tax=Providencia huaxiensis TaxID=2027290 RepID=UPI0034E3E542